MSGKKKLARKTVVLVSSRRGQGRRRARSGVKRQAIRQMILNGAAIIVVLMVIDFLFQIGLSHEFANARRDPVASIVKSMNIWNCEIKPCVNQVVHRNYSREYAQ